MTDEQQRIRGYLVAQAAKLAPREIVEKVQVAMLQLKAAAGAVPPVAFGVTPAPGEWSANEVMAHVVESGRHFGGAIVRLLDGQAPGAPATPPPVTSPRGRWPRGGRCSSAIGRRCSSASSPPSPPPGSTPPSSTRSSGR